jgi:EAL domain-containing protein (putative c-di-GMP-specific phosphodiesterase class I)/GGDEF domain-containing protein
LNNLHSQRPQTINSSLKIHPENPMTPIENNDLEARVAVLPRDKLSSDKDETERFLDKVRACVDFAFQPIVNVHSGACYGLEALLRGHQDLGFGQVHEVFDYAYRRGFLHQLDVTLRDLAISKFVRLPHAAKTRLFFNLDNRVIQSPDYHPGGTLAILQRHGLSPTSICFELSERHEITVNTMLSRAPGTYRHQSFGIAIDDFGTGYSGFKLLYQHQPDFIKIDRFFISEIHADPKKKLFVSKIVSLAHVLHIGVIAEGVETEKEFLACKDISCDLIQGYLIQPPTIDLAVLRPAYDHIFSRRDLRVRKGDRKIIDAKIEELPTVSIEMPLLDIFEKFRANKHLTFFPVVDRNGAPLGLIKEEDLKDYTYSNYGKDLLTNKTLGWHLKHFMSTCPVASIDSEVEQILEIFSLNENSEGVVIADELRYAGFLSARSLLQVINEKNIARARDENPLSKLPGNNKIANVVAAALNDTEETYALIYFDFDNFKPFNDVYGFRQGDRAILLFAELLQKFLRGTNTFLGHVGGDDFFAAVKGNTFDQVIETLVELRAAFKHDVETFYDQQGRECGAIVAKDREGRVRTFPMMTVSAAVVMLPCCYHRCSLDDLMRLIAELKKDAKASPDGLCSASHAHRRIGDRRPPDHAQAMTVCIDPESPRSIESGGVHRTFGSVPDTVA